MRALVRGEEMGLSDARYVVAKILSRSSSWGRSIDDFQRLLLSWAIGAVRERPVCERLFGVTASCSATEEGVRASWLAFDLTDAGGEVVAWASCWGDMGSTSIRPSVRHRVAESSESMAEIARFRLWARRKHSGKV